MTVEEIINYLKEMPNDSIVIAESCYNDYEVGRIETDTTDDGETRVILTW